MRDLSSSRYLGLGRLTSALARLLKKDAPVRLALGLERDGKPLLMPWIPPYFDSMADAVRALVEFKFGANGVFRDGTRHGAWRDPEAIAAEAQALSPAAVEATIAYCEYFYGRFGRFPAYSPPFRTVLGYQANHVDIEFYDRHYRPEALSETQRHHMELWHGGGRPAPT